MLAIDAPEYIKTMFAQDPTKAKDGRYDLKLYCNGQVKWVALDDYFPCDNVTVLHTFFIE